MPAAATHPTRPGPRFRDRILVGLAVVSAVAALAPATATAAPGGSLEVVVRGSDGVPLEGIDVRLEDGATPLHANTDTRGQVRFPCPAAATEVVIALRDDGTSPRFTLTEAGQPVELRVPVDPGRDCAAPLQPTMPEDFDALLPLVRALDRGMALMTQLGIHEIHPLTVEVRDPVASPDAVYWSGPLSYAPDEDLPWRIVLGTEASRPDDPGAPDNRAYHELGHHALASAFGALPRARDHVPGGGYHFDPSSVAAWTEGFSIAFAALVAREIEGRPDAGRYRVGGAWLDLELDYRPWDLRGHDAVAVASLLWDVVDGPREATPSDVRIEGPVIVTDAGVPHLLVARVHNPVDAPVQDVRVRVQGLGWTGTAPVAPTRLAAGGDGWIAIPLPDAVGTADDPLERLELTALAIPDAPDDDPVQVDPADLWTAIAELRNDDADANGRLFEVGDLYEALRGRFGGSDADGDGRDDIDGLFIDHGLFGDVDGNRRYDREPLGQTTHPGRTVKVDGQSQTWPSLIPRGRLELPPALRMQARVDPAEASILVLASGSTWGGYSAHPDAEGRLLVVPPPARDGATLTVLAAAPGRRPTVLLHRDATALLAELEQHEAPYLHAEATLPDATALATTPTGWSWPRLLFLGGCIATLLGLVLVVIGWPRWHEH